MTWIAFWKILKGLPWAKILPVTGVVLLLAANFFYIFMLRSQRDIARANESKAAAELQVAKQNYSLCRANREILELEIARLNERIVKIGEEKVKLDADLAQAQRRAAELAAAEEELIEVRESYAELRRQLPEMSVCQTYEAVLVALAGG
jgi:septal ring factor EnvC (AmiA/AmiB activator)